ncbi:hypothetical protein ACW9KT_18165 [Hymenobacter sp. HD11105]
MRVKLLLCLSAPCCYSKAFLLLVVLLYSTALHAQTITHLPSSATSEQGGAMQVNGWHLPAYQPNGSEADTTGALLALFLKQRRAGYAFVIPLITGMFLAIPISTDHGSYTQTAEKAISPPIGIPVIAATVVGFIVHSTSYNKAHLLAIDQAYLAEKPIPAKYRRRLRPQHFNEAACMREAFFQQTECQGSRR